MPAILYVHVLSGMIDIPEEINQSALRNLLVLGWYKASEEAQGQPWECEKYQYWMLRVIYFPTDINSPTSFLRFVHNVGNNSIICVIFNN